MVLICDDLKFKHNNKLTKLEKFLPEERVQIARKYKNIVDYNLSLVSFSLLIIAIWEKYRIHVSKDLRCTYNKYGKPCYPNYNFEFNLSHCREAVMCGVSNLPIGLDIQNIEPFEEDVLNIVMSNQEISRIHDDPCMFYRYWTQKEAFLKCKGVGLTDNIKNVCFSEFNEALFSYKGYQFFSASKESIFYSVCSESTKLPNISFLSLDDVVNKLMFIFECRGIEGSGGVVL